MRTLEKTISKDYLALINRLPLLKIMSGTRYDEAMDVLRELARKSKLSKGEDQYFEVLSLLVKNYESEHFHFTASSPQDILRSFMSDHGISQARVSELAGEYESNISAFLSGKRNLGKSAAKKLGGHFAVDPALFLPKL